MEHSQFIEDWGAEIIMILCLFIGFVFGLVLHDKIWDAIKNHIKP